MATNVPPTRSGPPSVCSLRTSIVRHITAIVQVVYASPLLEATVPEGPTPLHCLLHNH